MSGFTGIAAEAELLECARYTLSLSSPCSVPPVESVIGFGCTCYTKPPRAFANHCCFHVAPCLVQPFNLDGWTNAFKDGLLDVHSLHNDAIVCFFYIF